MGNQYKISGIYTITCKENNMIYVGSSSNIKSRWYRHKSNLKLGRSNSIMKNVYEKYGINSLLFEIIEECSENKLIEREEYFSKKLKESGYKLMNCGEFIKSPTRGVKLSEKRIQRLREQFSSTKNPSYGKIWMHKEEERIFVDKEEYSKYIDIGFEKGLSKKHKENISKIQRYISRPMSEKNKQILREIIKLPKSDLHKKRISKCRIEKYGIKIICLQTEEKFNSLKEVADKYETTYQGIRQSIIRGGKCKGLNFYYLNNDLTEQQKISLINTNLRKNNRNKKTK
jgi:group I intron endonuclease